MTDEDTCYFDNCQHHISPNPPKDPRATYQALYKWDEQQRRQRMHDLPYPDDLTRGWWVRYMELVTDDADALYFGWVYAENNGLAYWASTKGEWVMR